MLQVLQKLFAAEADEPEPANGKLTLGDVLRLDLFEQWYQPKIDLRAKRLVGAEALVRARRRDAGRDQAV
jgi:EAL domain-containing protein (putative c-di-GMP-specific phosphodiesterase class I)